ncbi:diguanylate cyclase [Aureibaculum algae]|uniref:Diguanylate cyclase n=1 Tax=Aureibaculum algae TaxID=2584122 RepID=A0A5B7TNV8_9FLAO|nr:two-component regulator propeller domain-containing protein [Aureibaculum algae]QCX38599.1 diguanylate cyclase [Aureibaculum algae]
MNNLFNLIIIMLLLTLNVACVEKKSQPKEISNSEIVTRFKTNTLKFTSGIRAILQDSKGNYWFGSQKEGVSYYDGKAYQYFTQTDGLPDNQIRSIQEDPDRNIWFRTANGISMYNGVTFTNFSTEPNTPKLEWKATAENLWFSAGEKEGIHLYDGTNMNYLSIPKPKNENTNNSYGTTGISKDKNGNVWIATYSALFYFDGSSITNFDKRKLALKDNEKLHIRSVLADSKGQIWIGNNGIGVLLYNGESTINFSEKKGLIHTNSSGNGDLSPAGTLEHVFTIAEDSHGNIWFGDRDTGAWKYDGTSMINYTIDDKLTTSMIWCIYNDNENNLLFGMADGGVYKFNGKSFTKEF